MKCPHCGSERTRKNGVTRGIQRCKCGSCGRTFSAIPQRKNKEKRHQAILMYLNNVGIRKTALFLDVSRTTISNWVKEKHKILQEYLDNYQPDISDTADIIEMDEIYTFVQKKGSEQQYGLLILDGSSALLRLK